LERKKNKEKRRYVKKEKQRKNNKLNRGMGNGRTNEFKEDKVV